LHQETLPLPVQQEPHDALVVGSVRIRRVNLLTVTVTVVAVINAYEHRRRQSSRCGAITDPALLDLLLTLPEGKPVADPIAWAETSGQSTFVVERDSDNLTVTRRLVPPLVIKDVFLAAHAERELRAVQDVSLFASYARRWVIAEHSTVPERAVLEAKVLGVGIADRTGTVLLSSEARKPERLDAWAWMLSEKAYRAWIS